MEEEYGTPEMGEGGVEYNKPWYKKPVPVILVGVGTIAVLFILWLVYAIWSMPSETPSEPYVDLTNVPGRDPDVLGLRIDTDLGRMFVTRTSGHTLYVKDGDCTGACLDDWIPYLADGAINSEEVFGTITREDTGQLQYTWKGQPLYTYVMDTTNTTLGDGIDGEWQIARP